MADEKTSAELLAEHAASHAEALAAIRLAAARSGSSGYTLKLVDPIMVGSEKKVELVFRPVTVADVRAKESSADALVARLCNIPEANIVQLSIDDWDAAQEVLAGFAMRRVAGGLAR